MEGWVGGGVVAGRAGVGTKGVPHITALTKCVPRITPCVTRRNYSDYFNFEAGNQSGLSPETQAKIKAWLEANDGPALPFERTKPE